MNECSGRGSSFLFFVGVILPLTLFALTVAADFSNVMLQNREALTVADAAARAAGTAVDGTTGKFAMSSEGASANVDCTSSCTALDRATQIYEVSVKGGIIAKPKCVQLVTVTSNSGKDELTVTIPYSIVNLSFLGALFPDAEPFTCLTAQAQTSICDVNTEGCLYLVSP